MKQKLTEETDNSQIMVGDFNTQLSICIETRQKMNKEMQELNNGKNKQDLADIYSIFQQDIHS